MHAIRHLALVVAYGAAATASAAAVAVLVPRLDWAYGLLLGGGMLLAAGLVHEATARRLRQGRLAARLERLHEDQAALREELQAARRELGVLLEGLEARGTGGRPSDGGPSVGEVKAELNVLKSLVGRLSAPPSEASEAATGDNAAAPGPPAAADELRDSPGPRQPEDPAALEALREALRDDRIEVVLQPIVSLPQRKRRYYECYTRIRCADGSLLPAERYIPVAEREGLISAVDNMLLFRCVQLVRRLQRQNASAGFFCNVSPHTLADAAFFADFVGFVEDNAELATDIVFEFPQAELEALDAAAAENLERLGRLGCAFSLDQVRELDVDPAALRRRRVQFLKVEAGVLYARLQARGPEAVKAWKQQLDRAGVDLVMEKVEDEATLVELLDLEIDYGQGYLFGEPRPVGPRQSA